MQLLIWLFQGLHALVRGLGFFGLMAAKPLAWLFRAVFLPVAVFGYRATLGLRRRIVYVAAFLQVRLSQVFTAKHMLHVAVVALTFLVTATNIYASGIPGPQEENGNTSILGSLLQGENEILVEDADVNVEPQSTSYLEGQGLSVTDATTAPDYSGFDGIDDGQYDDTFDDVAYESPFANGVQVTPDVGAGDINLPPTRTQIVDYTVEEGDTIGSIAQHFGISVASVVAANNIRGALIRPGQKLRILPVNGITYVVKKGDTVQKIASTYNSEATDILAFNGLGEEAGLQVGAELVLPGGRLPPPPAPPKFTASIKTVINPVPAPDRVGTGKLLWPVASRRITQYFKGSRHTGLDVGAPIGTSIFAADDGIIEYSGWNSGGYGNMIIVNHGGGVYTRYGHASKLLVKVGEQVSRGDVIALVGSTGRSTGPHLHFEVMTGNVRHRLNPLDWVK